MLTDRELMGSPIRRRSVNSERYRLAREAAPKNTEALLLCVLDAQRAPVFALVVALVTPTATTHQSPIRIKACACVTTRVPLTTSSRPRKPSVPDCLQFTTSQIRGCCRRRQRQPLLG
jgi:hypothetical protein